MTLFINACARRNSRTARIANAYLEKAGKPYCEVKIAGKAFPVADEEFLSRRDSLIGKGQFGDPMLVYARGFAEADEIVIAAPYWDLSFPACLKQYIEQINVLGITFRYSDKGIPEGLCKASRIVYITTCGGTFSPDEFGFGYIKALAENYYGIKDVRLIKAEGLDLVGADVEKIVQSCIDSLAP
ncbi:MAG: NAD(P)H-dependent oxidoreductase [Clostridia bacterium]|nr:NAD(P)H-dependent oxidoreductase [Clostridia bacterium]